MHPQQGVHRQSLLFPPEALKHSQDEEAILPLPSNFDGKRSRGSKHAQAFWLGAANAIDWFKQPSVAYGAVQGCDKEEWFPDGELNTCYNCLDRHVAAGRGDNVCFQYVCAYNSVKASEVTYTYSQVLEKVQLLAGVLNNKLGVTKGDRVIIYCSMIPEAAFAILACTRIGAM